MLLLQLMTASDGYPLHTAVLSGVQRKEKVQYLMSKLPTAEELQRQYNWQGYNALHVAAQSVSGADVIRPLVEAGFDINMPGVLYVDVDMMQEKVQHTSLPCAAHG